MRHAPAARAAGVGDARFSGSQHLPLCQGSTSRCMAAWCVGGVGATSGAGGAGGAGGAVWVIGQHAPPDTPESYLQVNFPSLCELVRASAFDPVTYQGKRVGRRPGSVAQAFRADRAVCALDGTRRNSHWCCAGTVLESHEPRSSLCPERRSVPGGRHQLAVARSTIAQRNGEAPSGRAVPYYRSSRLYPSGSRGCGDTSRRAQVRGHSRLSHFVGHPTSGTIVHFNALSVVWLPTGRSTGSANQSNDTRRSSGDKIPSRSKVCTHSNQPHSVSPQCRSGARHNRGSRLKKPAQRFILYPQEYSAEKGEYF